MSYREDLLFMYLRITSLPLNKIELRVYFSLMLTDFRIKRLNFEKYARTKFSQRSSTPTELKG
jgi:hypothetical protein